MKKMDLGQTINTLANVGVIAGIVLLAVELSQNNALLRNEARYNLHLARTQEIEQRAFYPDLAEITLKAMQGRPLTELERWRLSGVQMARWVRWEWYYDQYRNGFIEEDVLPIEAWKVIVDDELACQQWTESKRLLTAEFVQFMDENVVGC